MALEEKVEARLEAVQSKPIGESVSQKKNDNQKKKHARSSGYK